MTDTALPRRNLDSRKPRYPLKLALFCFLITLAGIMNFSLLRKFPSMFDKDEDQAIALQTAAQNFELKQKELEKVVESLKNETKFQLGQIQSLKATLLDRAVDNPLQHHYTTASTERRFAYVYVSWGFVPGDFNSYGGYLANALIAAKLLRRFGSKSDVVFMVKMRYTEENWQGLPKIVLELLEKYQIKLVYLPNEKIPHYSDTMNKFYTYNLTEYQRILYLDSDAMPLANMDYVMELSLQGILEPTVVYSLGEPANAGFFVVEPSLESFSVFKAFLANHSQVLENLNKTTGWGHIIQPPDQWECNCRRNLLRENLGSGTNWDFFGAKIDQGYLYYYPKYVEKRLTNILGTKVITYREIKDDFGHKLVGIANVQNFTKPEHSPFWNYSKPFYPNIKPRYCQGHAGLPFCPPFYQDFSHRTGPEKFFKVPAPVGFPNHEVKTDVDLWYKTLGEILSEQKQNLTLADFGLK